MMLKRLSLIGFKSFADKTDFEFDRGVTCIVGPNGCGKSNLVDAIKWVLGEQSAKSLRGNQMQDVIFSGSSSRKPAGMAQVDLIFDNSDGKLPLDAMEVTVSRRLYRDGTSEYLLNGQVVRLKDIRELLLGTGIGADSYSIIEQGRVDVLLQASPLERRVIFDEAAGISKYRLRVKEALRKLERTEQNLLRLSDIIGELERRLRSVKVQAGRARNWQEYTARLKELQSLHWANQYRNLKVELSQQQEVLERLEEAAAVLRSKIAAKEADIAQIDAHIVQLDGKIGEVESHLQSAASQVQAQRERIVQTFRRMQEAQESANAARMQAALLRSRRQRLTEELRQKEAAVSSLESQRLEAARQVESLQGESAQAAAKLAELNSGLEEAKTQLLELVRQISLLHSQQAQAADRARALEAQRDRLADRAADLEGQIAELAARCEQQAAYLAELNEQRQRIASLLADLQKRTESLDRKKSEIASRLGDLKERRSGLVSRQQVLEELNSRYEGVSPAVRQLLQRRDAAGLTGDNNVVGLLGELIEVDLADARWVEAVLSDLDQVVVVKSLDAAAGTLEDYRTLEGRIRLLPLDRIGAVWQDSVDLSGESGFVGWAAELVRFDAEHEIAVRWALGRVGLTETFADAVRLAQKAPKGYRFVSRDGQVVEAGGLITLGRGAGGSGLISRRSELNDIAAKLRELEGRIAELEQHLAETSAEFEQLLAKAEDRRNELQEIQRVAVQVDSQLQADRHNLRRLEQDLQLTRAEVTLLDEQIRQEAERAASAAEAAKELERQQEALQEKIKSLQNALDEANRAYEEVSGRLTQARVELGRIAEKRAAAVASYQQTQRDLRQVERDHEELLATVRQGSERLTEIEGSLLEAQQNLAEACRRKESLQESVLDLRRQRSEARAEIERLQAEVKSLRTDYEQQEQDIHERRLHASQLQMQIDSLVQKAIESFQVDLERVCADLAGKGEIDWQAVEQEIANLRAKIERLGHVNLDAIKEQEELEGRLEFLTKQRDDLLESKRQLNDLIERLNAQSVQRFTERFEQIRTHFQELFRKLFGGGRADVLLTDPENVLESGIEIVARPPGKELQSISLLSGGEKALAAVALLLAIFKSNPGPFAVLDEVDAALDEANNERFNRLIREFTAQSQFIIITHNKRTMAIADALYGVTMQEAGVSKRVSVRFSDESAKMQQVA